MIVKFTIEAEEITKITCQVYAKDENEAMEMIKNGQCIIIERGDSQRNILNGKKLDYDK